MRLPLIASTLTIVLMMSACTDTTGGSVTGATSSFSVSGKNANEIALEREVKALQQQTRNIIVRNTIEGAVVGAFAGCALAMMMGGDEQDCARGAMVGSVAGGVGGNAVGRAAAEKNTELVKQDAILANLKGINSKLGSVQSRLSAVLAAQKSELASLKRQLDAKQISKSAYDARVRSINANRTAVASGLQAAESGVARSRSELASIERQGGRALPALQSAAKSTESRLKAMRGTIDLM